MTNQHQQGMPPQVFISNSWTSQEHTEWVADLGERLMKAYKGTFYFSDLFHRRRRGPSEVSNQPNRGGTPDENQKVPFRLPRRNRNVPMAPIYLP